MRHRVLLISSEKPAIERIKSALANTATIMAADPVNTNMTMLAQQFEPNGIIFDCDSRLGAHTALERTAAIKRQFPKLPLVVLGNEMSAQFVLAAMRANADDFVDRESTAAELRSVIIGRLEAPAHNKDSGLAKMLGVLSVLGAEEDQDFSLNLACALAKRNPEKGVLLVDLALPVSAAGTALGIELNFALGDAVKEMVRLDRALLESALARCPQSGLFVLPLAPALRSGEGAVDVQDLRALLQILRSMFDAIVVSYGPFSHQEELVDLHESVAGIFVCCNQRLSSVKIASQILARASAQTRGRVVLAIHEFAPMLVPAADIIRQAVGADPWLRLPVNWEDLAEAMNCGKPMALRASSAYMRALEACLQRLELLPANVKTMQPRPSLWMRAQRVRG